MPIIAGKVITNPKMFSFFFLSVNCNFKADIIPVDFVVNSLIVIGYHTATYPEQRKEVVHLTSGVQNPIKWAEILNYARMSAIKSPSIKMVRPIARNPVGSRTAFGQVNHLFLKVFSHFLFAYLFDLMMRITFNKPIMVKVTKKMHKAFDVLEHFTNREWCFVNNNYTQIFNKLNSNEQMLFESDISKIKWLDYCDALYMGSRRYLLNEEDSTIPQGIRRQKTLIIVYRILSILIYTTLVGALFSYFLLPLLI